MPARAVRNTPVVITPVPAAPSDDDRSPTEDVILDAARSCVARSGVARALPLVHGQGMRASSNGRRRR